MARGMEEGVDLRPEKEGRERAESERRLSEDWVEP